MNYILRKRGHSLSTLTLILSKMQNKPRVTIGNKKNADVAIRWGCTASFPSNIVINKAASIAASSNKPNARNTFAANDVVIPATSNTSQGIANLPDGSYVIRPIAHYGGNNFIVADDKREAVAEFNRMARRHGGAYCSLLIKKTNEYRVHVAHGKVLGIQEKPLPENGHRANMSIVGIPWTVLRQDAWSAKMCRMAINAVKSVGLDFGAVDIIKGPAKSEFYVLEINTSPQIASEIISEKYAKYFDWLLRAGANREHFALKAKLNAKGFAWTSSDFSK